MAAIGINHVSVSAPDLDRSVRFYRELFGMKELPTPNFGFPVRWLRVGDLQLHLFERPEESAPRYHHLALTVDDFHDVYRRAGQMGVFDRETFAHHVYELPGNNVQLYLRDPGGNLVEVDWPDVRTLDRTIVTDLRPLPGPQRGDNLRATLFLPVAPRR